MGIFRRNQETNTETGSQSSVQRPANNSANHNIIASSKPNNRFQKTANAKEPSSMKSNSKNYPPHKTSVFTDSNREYGVKQIIDLLKHIPPEQDLVFGAEMIKRTLSSMKISIFDILDDAIEKEQSAEGTIHRLEDEITDYMNRIEQLKSQIQHLNSELDDIRDAKYNLTANDPKLQKHIDIASPSHIAEELEKTLITKEKETISDQHDNILFDDENGLDSDLQKNQSNNSVNSNAANSIANSNSGNPNINEEYRHETNHQIDTDVMNDRDLSDDLENNIDAIFDDNIEEEGVLEDQNEDESNIVFARPKTNT